MVLRFLLLESVNSDAEGVSCCSSCLLIQCHICTFVYYLSGPQQKNVGDNGENQELVDNLLKDYSSGSRSKCSIYSDKIMRV